MHSLSCRACRRLLDEIKSVIADCKQVTTEPSELLDTALESIPGTHAPMGCLAYRELITEFLDGFVPAPTYHRFERHAADCKECSDLLTDVVYAVAACHGVHTYEDYEAPAELTERLLTIAPVGRQRLGRAIVARVRSFAEKAIPLPAPATRRSFAMGLALSVFTFAFLLLGFSDDGTVGGIYRQAQLKVNELYDRGARAYERKEEVSAELREVQSNIDEAWNRLGGDDSNQSVPAPAQGSGGN